MAVSVRVEAHVFADSRYTRLGRIAGRDRIWALGAMVLVWEHCTRTQTSTVDRDTLADITGMDNFADHVIGADLAELTESGIRIRGTEGRIEWYAKLREGASKGGRARAEKASRNDDGTLSPAPIQPEGKPPSSHVAGEGLSPLQPGDQPPSSPLTLALSPALSLSDPDHGMGDLNNQRSRARDGPPLRDVRVGYADSSDWDGKKPRRVT